MNEETAPPPPPEDVPAVAAQAPDHTEAAGLESTATPEPASAQPPPAASLPPPPPPRRRGRIIVPLIYALAFLILGGAALFLWVHPMNTGPQPETQQQLQALQQQVQVLAGEVQGLQTRPVPGIAELQADIAALRKDIPKPPDFGPIENKLGAVQQRVADLGKERASSPSGLAPLEQRISKLEKKIDQLPTQPAGSAETGKIQSELDALGKRIDAVQQSVSKEPDLAPLRTVIASLQQDHQQTQSSINGLKDQFGQLTARLEAAQKDQQALTDRVQTMQSADKSHSADLEKQLHAQDELIADLQKQVKDVQRVASGASTLARLQRAEAQLASGQKLGEIQGAPPALARFANAPPPTMAELRQSFSAAAQAALAASRPPSSVNRPFLDRLWSRSQDLISVREGDRVIVGDPAAGIIARAQADLDSGDLAGAVSALSALQGPAASAMAGWVTQAQALLDARAALTKMQAQL